MNLYFIKNYLKYTLFAFTISYAFMIAFTHTSDLSASLNNYKSLLYNTSIAMMALKYTLPLHIPILVSAINYGLFSHYPKLFLVSQVLSLFTTYALFLMVTFLISGDMLNLTFVAYSVPLMFLNIVNLVVVIVLYHRALEECEEDYDGDYAY